MEGLGGEGQKAEKGYDLEIACTSTEGQTPPGVNGTCIITLFVYFCVIVLYVLNFVLCFDDEYHPH